MRQLTWASPTIVVPLIVAALAGTACSGPDESAGPDQDWRDFPNIVSFMESDAAPDDVKARFREALENGALAPDRFREAIQSWRACDTRCMGVVTQVDDTSLTLTAVVDGQEWSIGLDGETVFVGDFSEGDFVEVLSSSGTLAEAIFSFSEPIQR
jgi:hypothetical protein